MRTEIGLRQILHYERPDPLKKLPKIERKVAEIPFQYRLCPANRLKEISQETLNYETQLGTFYDGEIYVASGLHYASVPVVGFLLHLKTRKTKELEKIFGETIHQLYPIQLEEFLVKVALEDFAVDVLREEELADLLEKFREEKQFSPSVRENVVSTIVQTKANSLQSFSHTTPPALTAQIKVKEEYYQQELQVYNAGVQRNRFNRQSVAYQRLIQQDSKLEQILSPFVTQSEPIARIIIDHPVYGKNLQNVITFFDQLTAALNEETEVQIGAEAAELIYLIQYYFNNHLEKESPLQFKDNQPDQPHIVTQGRYMEKFIRGLRTRLVSQIFAEIEKVEQTLAALPGLSAKIKTSQDLQQAIKTHLQTLLSSFTVLAPYQDDFMIIPMTEIPKILEEQLKNYLITLSQSATQTPQNYQKLLSLVEARALLQKAQVPTDFLDLEIKTSLSDQNQPLKGLLGSRRLTG